MWYAFLHKLKIYNRLLLKNIIFTSSLILSSHNLSVICEKNLSIERIVHFSSVVSKTFILKKLKYFDLFFLISSFIIYEKKSQEMYSTSWENCSNLIPIENFKVIIWYYSSNDFHLIKTKIDQKLRIDDELNHCQKKLLRISDLISNKITDYQNILFD